MDLKELQKNWDLFGKKDPLWAILTHPDKKSGKWDPEAFFQTGEQEIMRLFRFLGKLEVKVDTRKALDFGCGIGRLTQALANHFDEVIGVDIAPSMIDLAKQYNQKPHCHFMLNEKDDLSQFPSDSFSLVYTNITLQHMAPRYAFNYLREFARILAPGGIMVFQLPAELMTEPASPLFNLGVRIQKILGPITHTWYRKVKKLIHTGKGEPVMEMYGTLPEQVKSVLDRPDLEFIQIKENHNAGRKWRSYRYTIRKKEA